ncbi:MAG: patatin-like phospholipase family protein [Acidobacteria bacterium]|nr:patatin-like phospholipase family protein [Acidobacteriota bacterium]
MSQGAVHQNRGAGEFSQHLALTSSVSGGSVGCLFYLAGLRAAEKPAPGRLLEVASESSLSHIAWGLAFRDLLRFFFPIGAVFGWGNRAWALEKAWRRFQDFPVHTSLSDWERDVAAGKLPASVFNATLVETGDRFAISTVDLVDRTNDRELRREFQHLYPGLEIRATTAAGLSAAFPVVSPSSQIWVHPKEAAIPDPGKRYHITDGGFYDNYGVVSAIEFLEKGRKELQEAMPEVMVIRISGAVSEAKDASSNSFYFQMRAPLKALVNMRSASQSVRNDMELNLLDQVMSCLETADFPYPYPYEPLTWHLTQAQKDEIREAVKNPSIQQQLDRVERFLSPGAGCAANA